jgi:DNA-binding transcriptional regulator YhcF (GntR family)
LAATLGPQARRVYLDLVETIQRGTLTHGVKLRAQSELAAEYGVALMTIRQALARLEAEGLIASEHGRGTFVRAPSISSVLIVEDDPLILELMSVYVTGAGRTAVEALGPEAGLMVLEADPTVSLILTDVCMPTPAHGIEFIRAVHHRWPNIWTVAVTGAPEELAELHGAPECPMLVLSKPVRSNQIERILGLLGSADRVGGEGQRSPFR